MGCSSIGLLCRVYENDRCGLVFRLTARTYSPLAAKIVFANAERMSLKHRKAAVRNRAVEGGYARWRRTATR